MHIEKPCPTCGRWPQIKVWYIGLKNMMAYQVQLVCEDGSHILSTSYSGELEKCKVSWNRMVDKKIKKLKGEN